MNDLPPVIDPAPVPAKPAFKFPLLAGFLVGSVPWLFTCIPQKNYGAIPYLLFACFGLPVIAVVLAIISRTRPFGLGLLLACGLGWLVLGAICGGVFR